MQEIVDLLLSMSISNKLLFILHKPIEEKLLQFGMKQALEEAPSIEFRPRYSYFQFIKLVRSAAFIITDGGSNQEECYYLGKPCILMRSASERQEGIGENTVISNYQLESIEEVISNLPSYSVKPHADTTSPSSIITDTLIELDTISGTGRKGRGFSEPPTNRPRLT